MTRGLLGFGMGASDWGSTSHFLCLLAEVHALCTVMGGLATYEQLHMRATGFTEPQFAFLYGASSDFQELQEVQQAFADRQTK